MKSYNEKNNKIHKSEVGVQLYKKNIRISDDII